MPAGKYFAVGVWEGGEYVGVILFGRGSNPKIGSPYGLKQREVCELVRVALRNHTHPVSRMLSIAIRLLRRDSPGLRLIVSYADLGQDHHGGIYQAGNWIYTGISPVGDSKPPFIVFGKEMHPRSCHSRGWKQSIGWLREHVDPNASVGQGYGKHKYLYPLDKAMREQIAPLAKPYPKPEPAPEA